MATRWRLQTTRNDVLTLIVKNKILKTIENNSPITYSEIEERASKHGLVGDELDELLSIVGKDKRVRATARGNEIVYKWVKPVVKLPGSHLTWVRENYVPMNETNNADHPAFADLDFSFLFLSPEEKKQYDADAKGIPLYMVKSKHRKG